ARHPPRGFPAGFSASPAFVAQGIEHRSPKAGVAGSNPAGGTTYDQADLGLLRQEGAVAAGFTRRSGVGRPRGNVGLALLRLRSRLPNDERMSLHRLRSLTRRALPALLVVQAALLP